METIKLKYPVVVGGEKIEELKMRRPKVRDQLAGDAAGKTNAVKEVHMFANLCEVSPAVIEDLDMADYTVIQGIYSDFLS